MGSLTLAVIFTLTGEVKFQSNCNLCNLIRGVVTNRLEWYKICYRLDDNSIEEYPTWKHRFICCTKLPKWAEGFYMKTGEFCAAA